MTDRRVVTFVLAATCAGVVFPAEPTDPGREALMAGRYEEALSLLAPFADKGNAEAQNMVCVIHLNGEGSLKDYDEARKWFTRAAEQKLAKAQ